MNKDYKKFFFKCVKLLKKGDFDYLIIGGLAVNVLGEPRMTEDLDIILFVDENAVDKFLSATSKLGFIFKEHVIKSDLKEKRAFRLFYDGLHFDIILPSTNFEKEALKRKKAVKLWGIEAMFPTPEDLIIFKVIPGRPKDLIDASTVYIRNKASINGEYIEKWVQYFSDEAQDMRIYDNYKKIISGEMF